MTDWPGFFRAAASLDGVVGRDDGDQFGISGGAIAAKARREGWTPAGRRGWLLPLAADPDEDFRTKLRVIRTAVGDPVFGRTAAACQHRLLSWYRPSIEYVLPHGRRRPGTGMGWRSRSLSDDHIVEQDGMLFTDRVRTAVDLGGVLTVRALRNVLILGYREQLFSSPEIIDLSRRMGRHPGARTVPAAVGAAARFSSDSGFEHDVRAWATEQGLGPFADLFPFRCPDGVVVHLDLAWPESWVCLECDGPPHGQEAAFEVDRVRWRQITRGGWDLSWTTPKHFRSDQSGLLHDLQERLARADRGRGPAPRHRCPNTCRACPRG